MMEKRKREKRRTKFHEALLNLYHPPSPPPINLNEEESVPTLSEDINLDFDPDGDYVEKECSPSSASDSDPKKLTRAQRKRLRKRKLKETAFTRRKIIGPLLPSTYQGQEGKHSDSQRKPLEKNNSTQLGV
ncbi:uncharacterized protein [Typha angustifolia]|uniref:uncharacterized protein isoform X3 n=1 Tax=Typha angustifolia TaxID=59011 RepID=UPI003C2ED274